MLIVESGTVYSRDFVDFVLRKQGRTKSGTNYALEHTGTYKIIQYQLFKKIYETNDLASGEVMFAATGVTDGTLLKGVRINNNIAKTHSIVMRSKTKTIRIIEAEHNLLKKPIIQ